MALNKGVHMRLVALEVTEHSTENTLDTKENPVKVLLL